MFLLITAGRGPVECQQAVKLITSEILVEAQKANISAEVVDSTQAQYGLLSALVALTGDNVEAFARSWQGTIQWICKSTIRPNHGRKNWFAGVNAIPRRPELEQVNPKDLKIETMTAGGKGGQHVNKTESAVRLTHIPTGIAVVSRDERSQHRNRAIALARLYKALYERDQDAAEQADKNKWASHNNLERGNAVRTYEGERFKRVN